TTALDPVRLLEAKIEEAELSVAEAAARVEQAQAERQDARDEAADAMRNFRALLDSRAVRGTAPIRITLNVLRRVLRRGIAGPAIQAHVEQVFYPREGSKVCVVGWCWTNALRSPRL